MESNGDSKETLSAPLQHTQSQPPRECRVPVGLPTGIPIFAQLQQVSWRSSSIRCVAFVGLSASLAQAKEGSTARQSDYSLKRRGCVAPAAAAAGFRRAMPTTPRTVTSVRAARGTKIGSVVEFKSGDVICKPLSSSDSKSFGTTPSNVSPSL